MKKGRWISWSVECWRRAVMGREAEPPAHRASLCTHRLCPVAIGFRWQGGIMIPHSEVKTFPTIDCGGMALPWDQGPASHQLIQRRQPRPVRRGMRTWGSLGREAEPPGHRASLCTHRLCPVAIGFR